MKRKLEEMEYANHDKFGKVMEILKGYCEEKTKKKELEKEDKNKKKKRLMMRGLRGGMQLVRDSNGKLIPTGKTYAEATKERLLREQEKRKKRIADGIPEPPRQPRWSDEIMAMHLWRGVCMSNGMKPQKYQLRQDYRNMNREEINLDLLFRKVYKAKEEAAAAAAASLTTAS